MKTDNRIIWWDHFSARCLNRWTKMIMFFYFSGSIDKAKENERERERRVNDSSFFLLIENSWSSIKLSFSFSLERFVDGWQTDRCPIHSNDYLNKKNYIEFQIEMKFIDSFQTTNSFRFDRNRSTSTFSLSSSSGYGSPSNLSQTSSQCRLPFSKYFRQKLSKHKSLAEIFFSPIRVKSNEQIYDDAWNLDQQMNRIRSKLTTSINQSNDSDSVISMSVDQPEQFYDTIE